MTYDEWKTTEPEPQDRQAENELEEHEEEHAEIEKLKAEVAKLTSWIKLESRAKNALIVEHEKAKLFLLEEVKRLEHLLKEERKTTEELSGHIDVLCDALEEHTQGEYRVEIGAAREAIE